MISIQSRKMTPATAFHNGLTPFSRRHHEIERHQLPASGLPAIYSRRHAVAQLVRPETSTKPFPRKFDTELILISIIGAYIDSDKPSIR